MTRKASFLFLFLLLSVPSFAQEPSAVCKDGAKSTETLLRLAVDGFERGFISGFNDSVESQIRAFESEAEARRGLTRKQKDAVKEEFRASFRATMNRVRERVLTELTPAKTFEAKLAAFYFETFSEAELIGLCEFFLTPQGRKLQANQAKIEQLIRDFSMSFVTDERFLKIVREESSRIDGSAKKPKLR